MAGRIPESVKTLRERWQERISALTPFQQSLVRILVFLIKFTVLAGPFYVLLGTDWNAATLRHAFAALAGAVLGVIGVPVNVTGSFIIAQEVVIDVSRDSTGWKSLVAFTALVVASGGSLRRMLLGVVGGIVVIVAANVVRLVTMLYAVSVYNVSYELLHTVLWRWGLTVIVLGAWLVWMQQPLQRFGLRNR